MGATYSRLSTLITCRVIAHNFFDNISDLSQVRTNWHPPFATALIAEVDTVGNNLIGKKAKTALFEATDNLNKLIAPSKKALSSLKVQIEVDYKNNPTRRKVILDELGYTSFFKKITHNNQLAVIGILTAFKRDLGTYRDEFLANGTPPELLDRIAGYAEVVNNANILQEQLKITTKSITAEAAAQLKALYEKIIGICQIAANFYLENRIKKELFTFSKVIGNLGYTHDQETTELQKE